MPQAAGSLGTRGSHTVTSRRQDPSPMNQTIHIHVASQTALQFGFLNRSLDISISKPLISAEKTASAHSTRRISADAHSLARRHKNRCAVIANLPAGILPRISQNRLPGSTIPTCTRGEYMNQQQRKLIRILRRGPVVTKSRQPGCQSTGSLKAASVRAHATVRCGPPRQADFAAGHRCRVELRHILQHVPSRAAA